MTEGARLARAFRRAVAPVSLAAAAVTFMAAPAGASGQVEPAPDTYPNQGTRILVIGDSITGDPGCWRAHMWRDLTDAGYEINMVGTRHEDQCGAITNAAGATWDPDHTGISGITTAGMSVRVGRDGLLERTTPDMVVMMLGTNDILAGDNAARVMSQYEFMVDVIRRDMPEGPIVIAAPPPLAGDRCLGCQGVVDEISAGLEEWSLSKSTPESPVFAATHVPEFSTSEDMWDGIHPKPSGEEFIAAAITPVVMEALEYTPDVPRAPASVERRPIQWLTLVTLGLAGVGVGMGGYAWSRGRSAPKNPAA